MCEGAYKTYRINGKLLENGSLRFERTPFDNYIKTISAIYILFISITCGGGAAFADNLS